jgi:teichuronic acid biosynthesis glycosyltransferase TuaG
MNGSSRDLVSVIIPVYNAGMFLSDTILTVINQTYTNWELLLIDDYSNDNSIEIIEKYIRQDDRIKLFRMDRNSGVALARNKGIEESQGVYIAFLDADDLWDTRKLEKQVTFMQSNKHAFTFTGYEFANAYGEPNGKVVKVPIRQDLGQALKNTVISTCSVMIDTRIIPKEHIKMPDLRYGEDAITWWNLLRIVDYAYGINEVLFYYRRTPETLSANKLNAAIRKWNLYRNQEDLPFLYSLYCYSYSMLRALRKRM